jgi:leucyl-tRNA synthetase
MCVCVCVCVCVCWRLLVRLFDSGAVMAVPAHDDRDHRFALQFNLPVVPVVTPPPSVASGIKSNSPVYSGREGTLVSSGPFTGLTTAEARHRISSALTEQGYGGTGAIYRLRDWLVSRQRYVKHRGNGPGRREDEEPRIVYLCWVCGRCVVSL